MPRLTIHYNNRRNRVVAFFILTGTFFVVVTGTALGFVLIHNLPSPARLTDRAVVQSTKIWDRTGKVLLYEIHGEERRTVIPFNEIPSNVRSATIAAEDEHFYQHAGLDWHGIVRALLKNIASGDISQGGSTITQQLVKKALLSDERTFTRKIKEAILAILIERRYSKDEILGLYLNQIPYGSNAYGIAAAAQTYFAKPAGDLNLAETAVLVALPKAPSYYSPYGNHKDELLARKDWILGRMAELGYISASDAKTAKAYPLTFSPPHQSIRAPHFVMYVRELLNEKYGEEFVEQGGLNVITTLDWDLQQQAEKSIAEGAARNEKLVGAKNAALVAVDPTSGDILAMVGSRDYFDLKNDGNVNVTLRPRQPGSAFKPFVYATAFAKGYTPETVLFDVPTEFNTSCSTDGTPGPGIDPKSCYHPKNYDGTYRGPVTLRQALAQSLNVPSVKLLYLAGIADSIKTARTMGISTLQDPARYGLTLVLGGAEVNLLEMTSAFGAFAQDGILHEKTPILRIENSDGLVLEEKKDSSLTVISPQVARTLNNILSDNDARVPVFSPQSSLYFPDRNVAAKTGTTQDYRDAWTIGYTPSLAAGVWVGNNDNTPMNQSGLSVMVAGPIWHQFMKAALAAKPPEDFTPPAAPAANKAILRGLYRSGSIVKIDKISGKLANEFTPPELVEETSYGPVQSILALVSKDNPEGPAPSNPFGDPQYKNWQEGMVRWLSENNLTQNTPPQSTDDVHTPNKHPKISLVMPSTVSALSEISVAVKKTFPLQEISLFINDELVESKTSPLLSEAFTFVLENPLPEGTDTIKITAYDAVGNKEELEKKVTVIPISNKN